MYYVPSPCQVLDALGLPGVEHFETAHKLAGAQGPLLELLPAGRMNDIPCVYPNRSSTSLFTARCRGNLEFGL